MSLYLALQVFLVDRGTYMIWLATSVFMDHLHLRRKLGTERNMYSDPRYEMLLVLEQERYALLSNIANE